MNSHGLTRENLVATLPPALQKDPSAVALAEAMADQLARRPEELEQLRIYPVIDRQGEQLLDILAYDFKVDWWNTDYSLDEKRQTLKDSWKVHKLLGTKTAVELGLRAIYPHTKVLRWWEYGGEPYHYRLDIDITNDSIDSDKQRRVLQLLEFYRSLRDHNDGVRCCLTPEKSWAVAGGTLIMSKEEDRVSISVPLHLLTEPGGTATVTAGGCFTGSAQRIAVRLDAGRAARPTGRARTAGTAGVFHSYQRMSAYIPALI